MGDLDSPPGQGRAPGAALAVLLLDVDNFKRINDSHGHIAGDEALRCLAERIHSLLRAGDALGRMGGEEFLIILDRARPVIADAIAERIRAGISRTMFNLHDNLSLKITVSIGVVNWQPGDTIKTLYAKATRRCIRPRAAGAIAR